MLDLIIIELFFALSTIMSIVLAVKLWSRRSSAGANELGMFWTAASFWCFGSFIELLIPDLASKLWMVRFQYIGIVSVPIFSLLAIVRYVTHGFKPSKKVEILLFVIPTITFFLILTSDYQSLMYKNPFIDGNGNIRFVGNERGPWYWVHVIYSYIALLGASVYTLVTTTRFKNLFRLQNFMILVATVLPWITNIIYLLYGNHFVDATPITLSISAALVLVSITKYKYYDLLPSARENIFESIGDPIFVIDDVNRIVDINNAAKTLTNNKEIIGLDINQIIGHDLVHNGIKSESLSELRLSSRVYDVLVSAIDNKGHNLLGAIVHLRDITDRKVIENELIKSAKELTELNQTKDKFFSIIAHDLKSPFQGLIGFSTILKEDYDELHESERKEMIGELKKMSESMYKLLENLLQWSRMQTGRIEYIPTEIDMRALVNNCLFSLNPAATLKKIDLKPSIPVKCKVYADSDMVNTVVRNLISNGIKFTPEGGAIEILSSDSSDGYHTFSVKDNGIGIKEDVARNLFTLGNSQTTPGTAGEKGTGLGLILCKEFIELNRGKIWVESSPQGTTFSFTLPKA